LTQTGTIVKTSTAASILFLIFFMDMAPCRPLRLYICAHIHEEKNKLTAYRQYDEDK
jgi:hypothetical protein